MRVTARVVHVARLAVAVRVNRAAVLVRACVCARGPLAVHCGAAVLLTSAGSVTHTWELSVVVTSLPSQATVTVSLEGTSADAVAI